jgi:hypothetical protein
MSSGAEPPTSSGAEPPTSSGVESLGLTVCRLGLDPGTGRIRNRAQVGIAIRGALFVELALSDRLTGAKSPRAIGESLAGGGLADSVHASVAARGLTPWKRWFSHTGADVDAAVSALVEAGSWRSERPGRYIDNQAELTAAQAEQVNLLLISSAMVLPGEVEDAVVALLAGGAGLLGGGARPRTQLTQLDRLLVPRLPAAESQRQPIQSAVRHSLRAMRGRGGLRLR